MTRSAPAHRRSALAPAVFPRGLERRGDGLADTSPAFMPQANIADRLARTRLAVTGAVAAKPCSSSTTSRCVTWPAWRPCRGLACISRCRLQLLVAARLHAGLLVRQITIHQLAGPRWRSSPCARRPAGSPPSFAAAIRRPASCCALAKGMPFRLSPSPLGGSPRVCLRVSPAFVRYLDVPRSRATGAAPKAEARQLVGPVDYLFRPRRAGETRRGTAVQLDSGHGVLGGAGVALGVAGSSNQVKSDETE